MHNGSVAQLERDVQRLKREAALHAPPRVENRLITVIDVYRIARNTYGAVNDPNAQYSWSGNGPYRPSVTGGTPIALTGPQVAQLDLAFKEYKYWTPVSVTIDWYPDSFKQIAQQASVPASAI